MENSDGKNKSKSSSKKRRPKRIPDHMKHMEDNLFSWGERWFNSVDRSTGFETGELHIQGGQTQWMALPQQVNPAAELSGYPFAPTNTVLNATAPSVSLPPTPNYSPFTPPLNLTPVPQSLSIPPTNYNEPSFDSPASSASQTGFANLSMESEGMGFRIHDAQTKRRTSSERADTSTLLDNFPPSASLLRVPRLGFLPGSNPAMAQNTADVPDSDPHHFIPPTPPSDVCNLNPVQVSAFQEIFPFDMGVFSGDSAQALSVDLGGNIPISLGMGALPPVDPGGMSRYSQSNIYQTVPPLTMSANYTRGHAVGDWANTACIYYEDVTHFEAGSISADIAAWGSPPQCTDYPDISDRPLMGNNPHWDLDTANPFPLQPVGTSQPVPSRGVGHWNELGYFTPHRGMGSNSANFPDLLGGESIHSGCPCPITNLSCSQLDACQFNDGSPEPPKQ